MLATIIMNITLPCVLLTSASGITLNGTMLILLFLGITTNLIMILVGYIAGAKFEPARRAAYMINCSGYNIGNFTLPFVQSFFPGIAIAYLCMFDIGNAMMGLGGTYAIASGVANATDKITIKSFFKKIISSISFDVYIIVFCLSVLNLSIPTPVLSIATYIGNANGFLVMLMIGLLLEIKMDRHDVKDVVKIISLRICFSSLLAVLSYYVLPLPLLARKILALALMAPVSSVATVFSRKCGYEKDMPAAVNSLTIIISILLNILLLLVFV